MNCADREILMGFISVITMTSLWGRWRLKSPAFRLFIQLNRLFRRRPKKPSKLRVTGLCEGNSPVTGEIHAQRASNAEMFPFDDAAILFVVPPCGDVLGRSPHSWSVMSNVHNHSLYHIGAESNLPLVVDDILSFIFVNEKVVVFWFKFSRHLFQKLTISGHWFKLWLGIEQTSKHYLNFWWFLLTLLNTRALALES